MELTGQDLIDLYTRLGEMTELLRIIGQDQIEMKQDIKEMTIYGGERKYIYGAIFGLYTAGIGIFCKLKFF